MNILLTGASSGIGFETLKQLIENNHFVYAVARDFSKIDSFFQNNSTNMVKVSMDLSSLDEIEKIFTNLDLKDQKLDALIHCAGMEETIPLTLYSPDKINKIFSLNVFSGIELLRLFSKKKYSNDGASVVFLSSVMGILGQPGKIGYCATKSALIGVVKSSALELAKRKIRVNAILPGVVNTPMTAGLFNQISDENIKQITEMHPLGLGEVSDIVPTILFLISEKSRWITGQNIVIDGGYSIQ